MANAGRVSIQKLMRLLDGPEGLRSSIAAVGASENVRLEELKICEATTQNAPADLVERSGAVRYPTLSVYCERVTNLQREKFRSFSGKAHLAMEVRISQDRLEGMEALVEHYVDAVTRVLEKNRGDWGDSTFFGGGYDAVFGPVKRGGRNYLQTAKISIEVDMSIN